MVIYTPYVSDWLKMWFKLWSAVPLQLARMKGVLAIRRFRRETAKITTEVDYKSRREGRGAEFDDLVLHNSSGAFQRVHTWRYLLFENWRRHVVYEGRAGNVSQKEEKGGKWNTERVEENRSQHSKEGE